MDFIEWKKNQHIPWHIRLEVWLEEVWERFLALIGRCPHSATVGGVNGKTAFCLICKKEVEI